MSNDRKDAIRARAYELWITEGQPDGRAEAHWRQAEQEYGAGRLPRAGDPSEPRALPDLPAPEF